MTLPIAGVTYGPVVNVHATPASANRTGSPTLDVDVLLSALLSKFSRAMSFYNSTGEFRWFIAAKRLNLFFNGVQDVPHHYRAPVNDRGARRSGALVGGLKEKQNAD